MWLLPTLLLPLLLAIGVLDIWQWLCIIPTYYM